ncbi:AraC family transcriptional regulator [Anopheles sinensis]|uniref:AraC family transcriptional regulator n=1 Tax=Anopheles sinensis TaxID=74873 RepID=A0A084VBC5_ANOSI|nr:AraC family transcriptional regulator [Anopheles sinensis]
MIAIPDTAANVAGTFFVDFLDTILLPFGTASRLRNDPERLASDPYGRALMFVGDLGTHQPVLFSPR